MKLIYTTIIMFLFLVSRVIAEMDHFNLIDSNNQYTTGDTISFLVDDMPDDEDQTIMANLHKIDGSFIKTIHTWSSQEVDDNGDEFSFQWSIDVTEGGSYYVEIKAGTSMEDTTKSVPFTVNDATPAPQPVQGSSSSLPEEDPITESHQPNLLWSKPGNEQEVMPSSSEKEMEAADDAAVAQEKAWIAQQQKHSSSNSPKHSSTKSPKSHHQTSPKSHAVDIVNQVKAAAAINKAASIAHLLSHQKRNAYRHIHKNRAKFAKRNLL